MTIRKIHKWYEIYQRIWSCIFLCCIAWWIFRRSFSPQQPSDTEAAIHSWQENGGFIEFDGWKVVSWEFVYFLDSKRESAFFSIKKEEYTGWIEFGRVAANITTYTGDIWVIDFYTQSIDKDFILTEFQAWYIRNILSTVLWLDTTESFYHTIENTYVLWFPTPVQIRIDEKIDPLYQKFSLCYQSITIYQHEKKVGKMIFCDQWRGKQPTSTFRIQGKNNYIHVIQLSQDRNIPFQEIRFSNSDEIIPPAK